MDAGGQVSGVLQLSRLETVVVGDLSSGGGARRTDAESTREVELTGAAGDKAQHGSQG